MATNEIYKPGYQLAVVCSNPTTPASGGPVRYGNMTGLALADEDTAGLTPVDFGSFVADLSVKGVDDNGNSAVAVGDAIWYVDADTPKLSKKTAGYFFGIALETVNSAATGTIKVLHVPSPGTGTLAAGSIGSTQLASSAVIPAKLASDAVETAKILDANVTIAKLTATMQTGVIQLPIGQWREIVTNAIPNTAANGGLLASDTTPILERVNGATDKQERIDWVGGNADEIVIGGIVYPPELDDAAAIVVHILAAMSNTNDTPVIGVSFFEGIGDTNAGGNTAAITGTALTEYTVSIAHGDVGAHPKVCSIGLTPGTHATDALYVYAVWLEYTRK